MTKRKPTDPAAPKPAKKPRTRKPQHFLVTLLEAEQPIIVIAPHIKAALKYVAHIVPAKAADLIEGGKRGFDVIDITESTNTGGIAPVAAVDSADIAP